MARFLAFLLLAMTLAAPGLAEEKRPKFPPDETLDVPSLTLTNSQFLSGAAAEGVPVTLSGRLRFPGWDSPVPAVVLLHGSDGYRSGAAARWAAFLNRMGIATFLASKKFIKAEQEAGKASFVLGLCFISEGAIPFAAKDPMRVIPACMVGGALTGALSMLFGCELVAPHGGLFVLFIPNAISNVMMYILAIAAGSLLTGVSYAMLKRGEEQARLATA